MNAYHPTLSRPRLYTASKPHRAQMWQAQRAAWSDKIEFTARWIDMKIGPLEEATPSICREGWTGNIMDVCRSNYLICYAERTDPISGAIVEIGAMLATDGMVILLGDCERYGSWRHHPNVRNDLPTIHDAMSFVAKQGLRV